MPYYLAIEMNPDSYEAINIKTTEKGKEIFKNDKCYECTLDEVDKFTTEYTDLTALRDMLYNNKKVPWLNCSLALVNLNGIEIKITQDFLFSSSKKYLENPSLVVEYLTDRFLNFDIEFVTELSQFVSDEKTKSLLKELANTMNECVSYNTSIDVIYVMHIAQILVFNCTKDEKTINYENLHNVVLYIANYENKKIMENAKKRSRIKNT